MSNAQARLSDLLSLRESAQRTSEIAERLGKTLDPPPNRTADQWADAERVLPAGNAIPGPWDSNLVPHTREICRAVANNDYTHVVAVMGTQCAKTELELNVLGHRMDDGPRQPALLVEPTRDLLEEMMEDRLMKLIESCDSLSSRLHGGQANKKTEKIFSGVPLRGAWSGSATQLASRAIALMVVDEVDRMDLSVGNEGDPITSMDSRMATYWNKKMLMVSSPTIEGISIIWRWFMRGTLERWAWPCPHCEAYFVPLLERLKWPKDATPEQAYDECFVECPHCEYHIHDEQRFDLNAAGIYIPHEVNNKGELVPAAEKKETRIASFQFPGLASPFVSFNESAEKIVAAYRSHNQQEIQGVINQRFGQVFMMEGQQVDLDTVENLIDLYAEKTLPDGVQMITGGIDVQKDGLYLTVRGWGWLSESWLLHYDRIHGDTDLDSVWLLLSRIVEMDIGGRKVRRWLIDGGYRPGDIWRVNEHKVKKFAMKHAGRVSLSFGRQALNSDTIKRSEMKLDAGGQKIDTGIPQYIFDTDHFKQWLHSKYKHPIDQPGAFHLHKDTSEEYLKHLVSEELIFGSSGQRIWKVRLGHENHYFDCEVMARVAAVTENVEQLPQKQAPARKRNSEAQNKPNAGDWMAGYR